jgi:hypothetical protein
MRQLGDQAADPPASHGSGRHRDAARPRGGTDAAVGKGPVRGFPPAPGQSAPLYPPGQFAAWNRLSAARGGPGGGRAGTPAATRAGDGAPAGAYRAGRDAGRAGDDAYEPDYSAHAVSDPAADVTSTQTWHAISDSPDGGGAWTSPRGLAPVDSGVSPAGRPPAPAAPEGRDSQRRDNERRDNERRDSERRDSEPAAAGSRPAGSRTAARAAARGGSRAGRSGPRGGAAGSRPARQRRPSSAMLAGSAVLLTAVAAGAFLLHAAEHQDPVATASHPAAPTGAAVSAGPSLGSFGHIASRAADPLPLTVAQLYPASFAVGSVTFSRTTSKPTGTCASAVIGTALQAAVPAKACSQAVRASYLATAEKAMGTIGVLNLSTAASAAHAGHAADASDFIAQLQGPSGPTRALGQGAGLEEAATKGHYLILIWAQFVNSAAPKSPAQQAQLKAFMTQLFGETANVSLSSRMASGTP